MSLCVNNNFGYGINVDEINTDEERLKRFIESQPAVQSQLIEWEKEACCFKDRDDADANAMYAYETDSACDLCDLYENYGDNDDVTGFAGIVEMVLSASAGFKLLACRDHNDDTCYVVMPRYFPWETVKAYFNIKNEEQIKAIFEKNITILTDQTLDELDWGEQNVESFS